ncbi:putative flavoprotein involved in K+ transport [Geodermatophilus telluris]|uniref:Putative flavoprotein involved in K+ transport n=1 Tax=Geodermatophilus telluris TaxID=1190417 RepID=A0A1G6IIV7_9ACTN|nr:NAD(P)-binding domain-containing protein [Geodermatophilus telluris]SDC06353.1 putative flavoprotein involved in K+ transport [Geodermatophilus telluris]
MHHTPAPADREPLDVLVVGAGQAGLALGHHLARRGADFLLVDGAPEIGASWRRRWDSLRLFSPARYDSLPGLPFPAPADTHPGKDDVADYLAGYAAHFALPVRLDSPVSRLQREPDGTFTATTPTATLRAQQVVVATGPFQTPHVPVLADQLDPDVPQLHSADYRNPAGLPGAGRVLVVGGANSGLQIAAELAATRPVTLAVGTRPAELPQRIAGRDLFTWLDAAGFFTVPAHTRLGRRLRARGDLVIGTRTRDLRRRGVDLRPRLTGVTGRTARFANGTTVDVDAVVWATGYRSDHSWLDVPGVVVDGQVRHDAGVTAVPGLHVLGLPWQTCRGSALLGFVGADAAALDDRMANDRTATDAHRPGPQAGAGRRGAAVPVTAPA